MFILLVLLSFISLFLFTSFFSLVRIVLCFSYVLELVDWELIWQLLTPSSSTTLIGIRRMICKNCSKVCFFSLF
jgi:hypothetical protein